MTYKQIETSREIRLWLGQIIVPACALAVAVPEVRETIVSKAKNIKDSISQKFKRP